MCKFKNADEKIVVKYLTLTQIKSKKEQLDEDGNPLTLVEQDDFTEWLAEHYNDFKVKLIFITNRSSEGH